MMLNAQGFHLDDLISSSLNISLITFYGCFYRDGAITIALEFMDGGSLANVLSQVGPIPENVLASIAYQVPFSFVLLSAATLTVIRFFGVLLIFTTTSEFIEILNHLIF
jgi:serine/threonine protein kinase